MYRPAVISCKQAWLGYVWGITSQGSKKSHSSITTNKQLEVMCIIPPTIFKLDLICLLSDCALQSRKIICSLKLQFFVGYQISKYSIWQTMLTANHVVEDLCSLEAVFGSERPCGSSWKPFRNISLPDNLQTLVFGRTFNQTLRGVKLPPLKTLIFGHDFNQNMEGTSLPADLQSLTFGCLFNQSLENLKWPGGLKSLTLGKTFNRSLKKVCFPCGLQSLTFGAKFNQSLEKAALAALSSSAAYGLWLLNQWTDISNKHSSLTSSHLHG